MGLVSLLKEDKNCNVVMIFNKQKVFLDIEDEIDIVTLMIGETCENTNKIYSKKNLKHYLQKYYKDEMDYQQYKEKVIDYEVVIDENNEVALEIIKQKLIVKEN
ncbi:TPA: hypothetical protein R1721_001583, partial [Campylobacter lari]|nr:hypothetical protein [Campylobacter lari]